MLGQNSSIAISITQPTNGASLSGPSTLVVGTVVAPLGTTILVNGRSACVLGQTFFANDVPLTTTLVSIVANALAPTGASATTSVAIVPPTKLSGLRIQSADECGGVAPYQALFNVSITGIDSSALQQIEADLDGDGVTDVVNTDVTQPIAFTYSQVKTYVAHFVLKERNGATHDVYRYVQTQDSVAAQQPFKDVLNGLKVALAAGNVQQALTYFSGDAQGRYAKVFNELGPRLAAEVSTWSEMRPVMLGGQYTEFVITKAVAGLPTSFSVVFVKNENGVWKINSL